MNERTTDVLALLHRTRSSILPHRCIVFVAKTEYAEWKRERVGGKEDRERKRKLEKESKKEKKQNTGRVRKREGKTE